MRVDRIEQLPGRSVTEHESAGARVAFLARSPTASVVRIELEPGGRLGLHPAAEPQLFVVVEGEGTVSAGGGAPEAVSAGSIVSWAAGERHETRSDRGLVAVVVEGPGLEPSS